MNEKEFILESIRKIINEFKNISIIYFYKNETDTHFLKIFPKNTFYNEKFSEFCADIHLDFNNNYFLSSLCFVSDDSPIYFDNDDEIKCFYSVEVKSNNVPVVKYELENPHYSITNKDDNNLKDFNYAEAA